MIFSRLSLLVLLFAISQQVSAQGPDLQNVLDQLVQSYGGENNLRKMDRMIQEWDLTALMGNRQGTDTRAVRIPDQLRLDLSFPQKSETRILNGDNAHVILKGAAPKKVSGMRRDAMRLQLMRLYSPLILRNRINSLNLIEQEGMLALTLTEKGVQAHYMINRENWHIERIAATLSMNGKKIEFLTEYSDFAVIEGVLVHQKENKFAKGVNTAVLQLRQITFDASFEDKQFQP